jgi:hypothetical protein
MPPWPGLIGPAVAVPLNPASLAWIFACALTRVAVSSSSSWRRSRELASSVD